MRFSKLLVLSALWLSGLSAYAADLVQREAPEEPESPLIEDVYALDRTAQTFVVGDAYALFNKGSQMFYYQGNAWGTQATGAAENAMIVRFVMPNGKTMDDKALWLRNYVPNKGSWMTAFVTTGDSKVNGVYGDKTAAIFVDNYDGDAALLWVEAAGDKTYRISVSELNSTTKPEGMFVGIDSNGPGVEGGDTGTPIMPKLAEGEGVNLDWEFYPIPDWTAYFHQLDVYEKSEELKKMIEDAEAVGVDVTAAVACYNNLSSTIEDMNAAIKALKDAMSSNFSGGTAENPSDATVMLANPNFDNASSTGWNGTAPGMAGNGSHGAANVAEHYNKTFDTYQSLSGLPNGVYRLEAKTFHRGSWEDYMNGTNQDAYPYLYAATSDTLITLFNNAWSCLNTDKMAGSTYFGTTAAESSNTVNGTTYYIPNDPSAFRLYEEAGYYDSGLFFEVTDGNVVLGVKKDKTATGTDWAVFDTFSLHFYGNSAASFQKWLVMSVPSFNEDVICTTSYMETYKEMIASQAATNKAEVLAAIEAVKPQAALLQENISLWNTYCTVADSANILSSNDLYAHLISVQDLADYYSDDFEENLEELALTNDELREAIAMLRAMIEQAKKDIIDDVKPGDDVTRRYLINADFSNGSTGWTNPNGCAFSSNCSEAYEKNPFDLYQIVKNAKPGVYSITLQGFFRLGFNDAAYANWKAAKVEGTTLDPVAWVYVNDNTTPLQNVYDIQGDERISGDWQEEGTPASTFYVTSDGPTAWVTTDDYGNTWSFPNGMGNAHDCFEAGLYKSTAFGLIRAGEDMRIGIKGTLGSGNWAIWDNFKLVYEGYEANTMKPILEEAVAGIDTSKPMAKSLYERADALKAAAQSAIDAMDGDKMFSVLADIFDLNREIAESVKLFEELIAANNALQEQMATYFDSPYLNDAMTLTAEIEDAIAARSLENADAEAYLDKIAGMKSKLRMPAGVENATDENPVDLTILLETPGFDKDGENSIEGWTATGQKFGESDQLWCLALESWQSVFHIYQDVCGLPDGTYTVKVNGWQRTATPTYLYAESNGQTFAKQLLTQEEGLPEGYTAPSSLSGAWEMFSEDVYMNTLVVTVQGEKLRIGVRKDVSTSNDWIVLDNFQLWYHGNSSSLNPDGNAQGIEEMNSVMPQVVRVEYFTLDGRKATAAQKGIVIQKISFENGASIVTKVRR